jgi:hypothetical protein
VSSRGGSILKVSEGFRAAEALAEFANLKPTDSASVAYFRNNYPDFAPSEWWDYLYRFDGTRVLDFDDISKIDESDPNWKSKILSKVLKQWQHAQNEIQNAWKVGFKFKTAKEVSDLLKLIFYVDRPGVIWNSSQVLMPGGGIYELNTKLHGFHKGVFYLQEHPTQAKICENEKCQKYFVHVHGKRKLCPFPDSRGETCAQKRINEGKREWWHKKGKKQRQTKSKRKKSNRGAHNNA